ncbi:MAG: HAD hydrolase-like protein [Oscillospiraceae bacterium]|jgi:phosphoglycolate phosphatase|nr:HAD hydrolase-like protein [Oscillospiraceae bacterium]
MYQNILFDLDGTLINTGVGVCASVAYAIEKLGLPALPDAELKTFIGPPISVSLKTKFNLSDELIEQGTQYFRDKYSTVGYLQAEVYDGIFDLLKLLKQQGKKIGVATFKRQDYAEKVLQKFGLAEYFDCIWGSGMTLDVLQTKQEIINACVDDLSSGDKSTVVMIGDSKFDAEGAATAGVDFIGVAYGYGFSTKADIDEYNNVLAADTVEELIAYFA